MPDVSATREAIDLTKAVATDVNVGVLEERTMMKPEFDVSQFVSYEKVYNATYTAEGKMKTAQALADFVLSDFSPKKWNKELYSKLSNMFHHIAEYDMGGFFDVWFSSDRKKLAWIKNAMEFQPCGDPRFTHCDVERAIRAWLSTSGLREMYQGRVAVDLEARERQELKRLQQKYGEA